MEILKALYHIFVGERKRGIGIAMFNYDNLEKLNELLYQAIDDGDTDFMLGLGTGLGILEGDKKVIEGCKAIINEFGG